MLKNILKVGKALSKGRQQIINGGRRRCEDGCYPNQCCYYGTCHTIRPSGYSPCIN